MDTADVSLLVHIDGGARGNPGPAAAGVIVQTADDGTVLFEGGFFLGRATNNVAEYEALLEALSVAASLRAQQLEIRSDSELLVRRRVPGQERKPAGAVSAGGPVVSGLPAVYIPTRPPRRQRRRRPAGQSGDQSPTQR